MPIWHITKPSIKLYLKSYWKRSTNNLFNLFTSSPATVKWFSMAQYVLKSMFNKRVLKGTRGRHGYSRNAK
jgi:hypothetical protein